MALDLVIGGLVGAGALYLGWRRLRYVRAYIRRLRSLTELERALRTARDMASSPIVYRAPDAKDGKAIAALHADTVDHRDGFAACGFSSVGDLVGAGADDSPHAVLHAMGDPAGTTWVVLARYPELSNAVAVSVFSYAGGDEAFVTARRPGGLANPPFRHLQVLAGAPTCAELVAKHGAFVQDAQLEHVASLDELSARLAAFHARTASWRAAQPSDELLDADLRAVLGEHYAKAGKGWARRLRTELPTATVRRG